MLVLVVLLRVMFIDAVFTVVCGGIQSGGIGLKFYRRSCKPHVPVNSSLFAFVIRCVFGLNTPKNSL